jgi:hypothetical protein
MADVEATEPQKPQIDDKPNASFFNSARDHQKERIFEAWRWGNTRDESDRENNEAEVHTLPTPIAWMNMTLFGNGLNMTHSFKICSCFLLD